MNLANPLVARSTIGRLRVLVLRRPVDTPSDHRHHRNVWILDVHEKGNTLHRIEADGNASICDLVESQIRQGGVLLAVINELSDISRKPLEIWRVVKACVEENCRLFAINDRVDTASPNWESAVHVAVLRAGMSIPEWCGLRRGRQQTGNK